MDAILILMSWLILLVPGFDDSVPVTSDKIFKIETSPDIIQSITTRSDETMDFLGFDIELKQNSTGILEIKVPKNLPTPASFTTSWHHGENPIMLTDGAEIDYDIISDPCFSHYRIPVEDKTNLEILYPVILTGSWQLYSPIQFDESHQCYNNVFYEKSLENSIPIPENDVPPFVKGLSKLQKAIREDIPIGNYGFSDVVRSGGIGNGNLHITINPEITDPVEQKEIFQELVNILGFDSFEINFAKPVQQAKALCEDENTILKDGMCVKKESSVCKVYYILGYAIDDCNNHIPIFLIISALVLICATGAFIYTWRRI